MKRASVKRHFIKIGVFNVVFSSNIETPSHAITWLSIVLDFVLRLRGYCTSSPTKTYYVCALSQNNQQIFEKIKYASNKKLVQGAQK